MKNSQRRRRNKANPGTGAGIINYCPPTNEDGRKPNPVDHGHEGLTSISKHQEIPVGKKFHINITL